MIKNSIDCVIFGFHNNQLKVLLIERKQSPQKGLMALPGDFVKADEDIDQCALRTLKDIASLENIYLEQIRAFGDVARYPVERVITVGYYALINIDHYSPVAGYTAKSLEWCDITNLPSLAFDHRAIIEEGFKMLQHKVRHEPIGFNLLPETFSLTELQQLYEAILQTNLNKRNFRSKIDQMQLLVDTGNKQENVSHKPAKLFKFNIEKYEKLVKEGLDFKL
ncbi:NUDIX hydrolase [Fulvivirga lutimaris]|uniref:NUDIX hydrolase n=1 Tax=Fulvivirga lutimaris TaxID=1819566 RepID=UPI0012BBE0CB|nr:NUDIX domain-containing protein [Fulvivirga lutimaris]MTI41280.1 NUDIX domain-containing protein [Fulvivirga lutimaris]